MASIYSGLLNGNMFTRCSSRDNCTAAKQCYIEVRTKNFSLGGCEAGPEAIYNLYSILKTIF